MKNLFLLVFILVLSISLKAQINYKPGRIITLSNDTLYGFINDGGKIRNMRFCDFKLGKNEKATRYFPKDIKSYLIGENSYYYSNKVFSKKDDKNVFVECLLEGDMSLLYSRKDRSNAYSIKLSNNDEIALYNEVVQIDQTLYGSNVLWDNSFRIEIEHYKDTLFGLAENRDQLEMIYYAKYKHQDLQNIVSSFNALRCDSSVICNTYTKDLMVSKIKFGVFMAGQYSEFEWVNQHFQNVLTADQSTSFPFGAFCYFPINLISDRLTFRTELMYSKVSFSPLFKEISNDEAYVNFFTETISIPIALGYTIPWKKSNFTLSGGKELGYVFNSKFQYLRKDNSNTTNPIYGGTDYIIHRQQKGAWFLDFSYRYDINKKLSILSGLRVLQYENLIVENANNSNFSFKAIEKQDLGAKYKTKTIRLRLGLAF